MDKKIIILIIIGVLLVATFLIVRDVNSDLTGNVIDEQEIQNLYEVTLEIEGMYCESCAYGVKAQLEELEGVVNADIDYKTARGLIRYDADRIDPEVIAAASTAYPANVVEDRII